MVSTASNACLLSISAHVCQLRLQKIEAIANASISLKSGLSCSIMAIISMGSVTHKVDVNVRATVVGRDAFEGRGGKNSGILVR
jgi:hypothetical protein